MEKLIFLLLSILFYGCSSDVIFENEVTIGEKWSYDEPLVYSFEVSDTTELYALEFLLKHSKTFPYQNLYVNIETQYPDNKIVDDVVSLQLANSYGEFEGKCNSAYCEETILLQPRFKFLQLGNHTITVYQHSRKEVLNGVNAGTLRLLKVK